MRPTTILRHPPSAASRWIDTVTRGPAAHCHACGRWIGRFAGAWGGRHTAWCSRCATALDDMARDA
ncbi:MAG: hypothetical protein AVDCRST_MAG77-5348 [uncultured Chloroflexi bacterium]|uniref:Uncharacterized protein n=1 Tax=uncultured Chloroflexota bacterium TaxID=166587 RepID=A0A6J4K748_9CHLR|nr:MAG: hypothetical protein AVDCRST_MAG77-5348 [uncultured Chloroflexota bacterium]